jgi:hypothetical protein
MPFVLQALQEKHRKENWNKPIRNLTNHLAVAMKVGAALLLQ